MEMKLSENTDTVVPPTHQAQKKPKKPKKPAEKQNQLWKKQAREFLGRLLQQKQEKKEKGLILQETVGMKF